MATFEDIMQRRAKMVEMLLHEGVMSLPKLGQELGISESTIRRDLEALEKQGHVKRIHGGALCLESAEGRKMAFSDRQASMISEKDAMAEAIASEIADGQTVILDGGTTTFAVARRLQGRHISIVTNSVPIASLLATEIATEVTLIGGYLYPRTGVALGPSALEQLARIRASVVVLSSASIGPGGIFNDNQMMVDVENMMMDVAERVILAMDHTKFDLHGLIRLCGVDRVDTIVTDDGISQKHRQWLASLPAEVIVAGKTSEVWHE